MTATDTDERSAVEVAGGLVRAVLALARSTARMAGAESREVAGRVGRRLGLLVAASVVAAAGAVALLGAAAILAERALGIPRWAAFAGAGALALAGGAWGVAVALRRLAAPDLAFPRTVAELEKDLAALDRRGERVAPPPSGRGSP